MTYSSEVLADSPLAWWRLNETSGTTAADSSGNSHPGTYTGTYTLNQTGATGTPATLFTDAYVTTAYTASAMSAFTLEAWILDSAYTSPHRILTNGDASSFPAIDWGQTSSTYRIRIGSNVTNAIVDYAPLTTAIFHHHVIRYDGATLSIYVDSTLVGSTNFTATVGAGTYPWTIGGYPTGYTSSSTYHITATMQDVAIYGTALSSTRIRAHYDASGYTAAYGRARVYDQYVEAVVQSVPRARVYDQYAEIVVQSVPRARIYDQYAEVVRKAETHLTRLSVDVIVKPVVYASSVATRAPRTTSATGVALLFSIPRVAPAHATVTRTRTVPLSIAGTFNPTSTPVNAMSSTGTRNRIRTSVTANLTRGLVGDEITLPLNISSTFTTSFTYGPATWNFAAGEPDTTGQSNAGHSMWVKYTADRSGTFTIHVENFGAYANHSLYTGPANAGYSDLTFVSYKYYGDTDYNVSLYTGDTIYLQFTPYSNSSSYYSASTRLTLIAPPIMRNTTAFAARNTRAAVAPPRVGPFTYYVNIGNPNPMTRVVSLGMRARDNVESSLTTDLIVAGATNAVDGATRTRDATAYMSLDAPVIEPPIDTDPLGEVPLAPTLSLSHVGTGSLWEAGVYKFKVAYYVGERDEGRLTLAGDETEITLDGYAPPTPPA